MQAAVENALERRLDIAIPREQFEADVENRLKRLSRNVKVSGFRPGKVPLKIVAQQYGAQVRQEALGEALQHQFAQAVSAQNIKVAGYPRIEPKEGDGFEFSAVFEVYPEVSVGDLSGVTIQRPAVEVGDAEVDKTLDVLRKQRVIFEKVDRAAAEGDQVELDFRGTLNGEPFPGGEGKGVRLVVGEGRWLKDFEGGVAGMKAGETKSFDVAFPEEYQAKELAGKTAVFEVTAHGVYEPILPPVDAEFAKMLGVENGDVAALRKEVKENLEREVKKRSQAKVKDQAMNALLEAAQFDLPRSLVGMEIERLMEQTFETFKARGVDVAQGSFLKPELFEEQAKRRVKLGLILAELVNQHELHAKPEQVRAMVEEQSKSFEKPEDVVKWFYTQPDRLGEVESLVLEENVVNWVLSKAKVEDAATPFDELMGNA